MPPIGSLLILHNQALALLPQFYLSSALIVGGFQPQQQLWRSALLRATLAAVVAEVAWSGLHPAALPQRLAAAALLGALLLNALHLAAIYGLVGGLEYSAELALALHLLRLLLLIPVNQIGNVWTLEAGTERSQARWRIGGWIVTVALGLAVLLLPVLAESPACVIATVSLPSALMLKALHDNNHHHGGGEGEGGSGGGRERSGKAAAASGSVPARVSMARALLFLLGACVLGTNGEAMLDSAVGLTVRQSLVRGKSELALANQTAVLVSMLLALFSEVVLLKGTNAASRSATYIALWLGVQLLRSGGFGYLTDDFQGALLVWAFVFVDKYTGPLGNAAVETSLLVTLQQQQQQTQPQPPTSKASRRSSSRSSSRGRGRSPSPKSSSLTSGFGSGFGSWTVPGAMLLTVRHVVESSSRPFFELLLTPPIATPQEEQEQEQEAAAAAGGDGAPGSHWPVRFELVVLGLAGGTAAFVLLTLQQAAAKPKGSSTSTRKGVGKAKKERSKLE